MDIIKTIENAGLSKVESQIYVAALELGESLPKKLAEKAAIKRPTLYGILPKLLQKGLLTETVKGKRKYIVAQDMQSYLNQKKYELDEIQKLVPQLQSILGTATSKPKILVYEGVEGIKKIYYDHLLQKQPINELVGIENIHPELQKYIQNYYIPERVKRKIPLRMLVSGATSSGVFNVKSNSLELREVKVIDNTDFQVPLGLDVYGDSLSITLHRKNSTMIGIIIRSKEISTTMVSIFNLLWLTAKDEIALARNDDSIQ